LAWRLSRLNNAPKKSVYAKYWARRLPTLLLLLSMDFIKLVLLATVIAFPVAWYFLKNWLEKYAYQIDIEWWYFAIAAIMAVAIALLTVSTQAIRAALMNPVKSLKAD
jgi:putative ABC transport system permease protein